MAENRAEVLAGAAVLAAAIGFLVYAGQETGMTSTTTGSYDLTASFRSVEGVRVGTDVRLAGVKVGTVSALELNPETFFADATLTVQSAVQLPEDSAALISSEGLLGGNFVELVPGGALDVLPAGAEIEDTQGAVSVISLMMKFAGGGGDDAAPAEGGAVE
ncbi:outer membrane lipid asymmetry maintenance protein MlaD [Rhodobacteraceae bacterium HSP-20]|uniref:Outer membrane lipid asymmetry maintenance protein MlaD n=1 Tax=Paragemmobacter amnigenus TaxID=2852097 RepID=A0ABS6J6M4_9RHOB|nr:outer membrane lipid asymmetry maintenance protein MlaD [Rhodobacter amnigenus]MBU9699401.1 outer membrane lipid asymmetry maintenance protein MlaD [Rhodobacter amnigenus]MBV4390628.1 outer membrane lipid asymmetry maintenance protein MlaD [Rhodobacter amnigenus]